MFVRKKTTKSGTVKHYLVETYRDGGKVRQKVLYYLGDVATVEEELAYLDRIKDARLASVAYFRQQRDTFAACRAEIKADEDADERELELVGDEIAQRDRIIAEQQRQADWYAAQAAQLRDICRSAQK
jgi:hypothetical protein